MDKKTKFFIVTTIILVIILLITQFNDTETVQDEYSGISDEYSYMEINDLQYNRMLENYSNNLRTFDNAEIVLNPLGTNYLSAYLIFDADKDITYEYTVEGKTDNADFNYVEDNATSGTITVPIVGLYADYENNVSVTITREDGQQTENFVIDTTSIEIEEQYLTSEVNTTNDNEEMQDSWLVTSQGLAYDINGDLRMYGLASEYNWVLNFTEVINGHYFIGDTDIEGSYYTDQLYSVDFMGRVQDYVQAPEGYTFHHDGIYIDDKYYFLGNVSEDSGEEEEYIEAAILVYDDDLNFVETIDLSEFFNEQTQVLANSALNDIHFNSISYIEEENQLVLSSRSSSDIVAYDLDNEDIAWIIGDESVQEDEELTEKYLDIDSDEFMFTSGQHTGYVVNNAKADDLEENQYMIMTFDNRSCVDENDANVLNGLEEEPDGSIQNTNDTLCEYPKSRVIAYVVDTEEFTVTQVDSYLLDTRSSYVASINEYDDSFVVSSALSGTVYILDTEWELETKIEYSNVEKGDRFDQAYRANLISFDEISGF